MNNDIAYGNIIIVRIIQYILNLCGPFCADLSLGKNNHLVPDQENKEEGAGPIIFTIKKCTI